MEILITGSREASLSMLAKAEEVVRWAKAEGHSIIVGDATGVDAEVRRQCRFHGVPVTIYGAYGKIRVDGRIHPNEALTCIKGTYPERDLVMARQCDICVAVWNGTSKGTKTTFEAARRMGKRVIVRTLNEISVEEGRVRREPEGQHEVPREG